jgi:hypothetical protein
MWFGRHAGKDDSLGIGLHEDTSRTGAHGFGSVKYGDCAAGWGRGYSDSSSKDLPRPTLGD